MFVNPGVIVIRSVAKGVYLNSVSYMSLPSSEEYSTMLWLPIPENYPMTFRFPKINI
jgi:hypothetical protein